jgi:Gas vesicle protein
MRTDLNIGNGRASGLVDVLDRVLDKGLVVAGDVKISLAEVELLTIRIRLIVCSIDKAQQIGLDWWKYDAHLAPSENRLSAQNEELRKQVRVLERKIASLSSKRRPPSAMRRASSTERETDDAR